MFAPQTNIMHIFFQCRLFLELQNMTFFTHMITYCGGMDSKDFCVWYLLYLQRWWPCTLPKENAAFPMFLKAYRVQRTLLRVRCFHGVTATPDSCVSPRIHWCEMSSNVNRNSRDASEKNMLTLRMRGGRRWCKYRKLPNTI